MNDHFRAKIAIEDQKVIFEINDEHEVYDAENAARESVKSWLDSCGDNINFKEIEIKLRGKSIKYHQ